MFSPQCGALCAEPKCGSPFLTSTKSPTSDINNTVLLHIKISVYSFVIVRLAFLTGFCFCQPDNFVSYKGRFASKVVHCFSSMTVDPG